MENEDKNPSWERIDKYGIVNLQCFTHEEVKEINKEIKKNIFQKEPSGGAAPMVSKTGDFFQVRCLPLMDLLHPWLYQCQMVNIEHFNYDIYWNFHLDALNYNVYGESGEYGWHYDASENAYDPKLTCLLNLSEEIYEGGEFYTISDPNKKAEFTSGMGIIFNSLIAHKVTPITKGERITLTYWAMGPSWR